MTNAYRWVQWNKHKKLYDLALAGAMVAYLGVFMGVGIALFPPPNEISPPILLMRALGTLAIIMLHVILCIGPLARITTLASPLLYNRRHLGVALFAVAFIHAFVAIGFYGGFGARNPVSAIVTDPITFGSLSAFPFEVLGAIALAIFFVMAATSHDFWLSVLSPRLWKSLHMLVYVAYGLVVMHVALGALQSEPSVVYAGLLVLGVVVVSGLHLVAGVRELRADTDAKGASDGWADAGSVDDLEDGAGKVVALPNGERVAVFRDGDTLCAMSNVCSHQGGPLGEGRIVDGCVTCPWHGYQYKPADGTSPPPYEEVVPTYQLRVQGSAVEVRTSPNTTDHPATPVRAPLGGGDAE